MPKPAALSRKSFFVDADALRRARRVLRARPDADANPPVDGVRRHAREQSITGSDLVPVDLTFVVLPS